MIKAIFLNLLFIFSCSAAFAGEEVVENDLGKEKPKNGFSLDQKSAKQVHSFSLRSGMYFKGENIINVESRATSDYDFSINLQKSQSSYLLPYKKKALLNKLTFNPNELLRNYSGK
ncbi:hypothetical protein ABDK00_012395 [Niabella insulamsoli]|uniref:hypothetical protein n=1 Tax=Niabella insulamsoli TaxID=3144874 RepID=UPI0031FD3625